MPRTRTAAAATATGLILAALGAPGCNTQNFSAIFAQQAASYAAPLPAIYVAAGDEHGPSLFIRNDTKKTVTAQTWVGRVNVMKPGGVEDLHTAREFEVTLKPGAKENIFLGKPAWSTGVQDAVVMVKLEVNGAPEGTPPLWVELERPAPYNLHIVQGERLDQVVLERRGGSGFREIPPERQIQRAEGTMPVYAHGG